MEEMENPGILRAAVVTALVLGALLACRCSCDPDGPVHGRSLSDTAADWTEGWDYVPADLPPDWMPDTPPPDLLGEDQICGEEDFNITHVTPDMLIVLDRSNSMGYSGFWDPTRSAVAGIAATYEATILFGLMVFPDMTCLSGFTGECMPAGAPVVDVALRNGPAIHAALSDMTTCGGTPTAGTLRSAHDYLTGLGDSHPKYVLLATDGAPNCNEELDGSTCRCTCTDPSHCSLCTDYNVNCLDDLSTLAAIDAMRADGIQTFVIGMSTAAVEWGDVLDQMAEHGATERFYPAEEPAELQAAFEAITGMVATCEFDLNPSDAADPNQVNFYFDGEAVPRDPAGENGWNWIDGDTIAFYGSYCDRIMGGSVGVISAKYGCPTIMI
jgi:hypothetical protein